MTGPFISIEPGAYEVVAAIGGYEGPAATGLSEVVSERAHYLIARGSFHVDYLELRHAPCLGDREPVRVRLQARNGLYLSAQPGYGGVVRASRDVAGPLERFRLTGAFGDCLESGEAVFLRTSGNSYLRADRGGGSIVASTGTAAGLWERFFLHRRDGPGPVRSGDYVTLQAANGSFRRSGAWRGGAG